MKRILSLTTLLISVPALSATQQYNASLDNSQWYLSSSSPIQCTLEHPIPRYGQANFEAKASKKINLDFRLDSFREMPTTESVQLKSVPPQWRPGSAPQLIDTVKFYQQYDGYVTKQSAWRMLNELERGQYPTFYYHDWYNNDQVVSVGLSSINFNKSFDEFNHCISQLLPYNFEDISYSILRYKKNGSLLTTFSKKRLKMIGEYIKHDDNINVILISGYSDSYGGEFTNKQLSEQRANSVKEYLSTLGFSDEKIKVSGLGEKHHIADNRTIIGRDQNRRVIISIEKEDI
ncbi:flagellar protein MotY [Psychromonas algicola]|uniref:flagellar protein MotY n=1 Tax=Psychromonas algicola TaxID=2555642 RepID=UPI001067D0D2|nr:OmpA family protein [Psychromonas sp. RZ5]TEW47844.1 OmpA family protein [Psychromonas sp. RZ5]